jgi:hypothetical protein
MYVGKEIGLPESGAPERLLDEDEKTFRVGSSLAHKH